MNNNHTKVKQESDYPAFGQDPYGARTTSGMRKKRLSVENSKDLTFSNDSKNLIDNYERVIKLQAVIRGWLVRKRRNLSLPEMKSGITTQKNSHRRISSNAAVEEYKSMQELMKFIIEKLSIESPEDI